MNHKITDTKTRVGVRNANAKESVSVSDSNTKSKVSARNASAKPKKKPRGKPFEKGNKIGNRFLPGEDPYRNVHGQRNKEAVQLTTEMRNLYVKVFNEEYENTGMSNLEYGVRRQVKEGVKGDNDAWEAAVNRTWGRSTQPIEVKKNDEDDDFEKRMEILFANGAPTVQARDAEIWRIVKNAQKRERDAKKAARESRDQGGSQ